jgi:hypothetical protein
MAVTACFSLLGCSCASDPLEFEPGWCFRCGRMLVPEVGSAGAVDGYLMLEAAIERERLRIRATAEARGYDRERYAYWLIDRIAAPA